MQATRTILTKISELRFHFFCNVLQMPFLFTTRLRVLASTLHLDSQVPYVTITLRCYLTNRFPNLFCYKVFSATRFFLFRMFFVKNQVVIFLVAACLLS